ncbi:hypothetical protein IFM89_000902 [Coptis chinensis]|uniref:DDT domain-containing protein n=1 Tax=Coptis chinensis TaxID=261450 RepID=A0A835IKT2_9MAGN|nr:hypothetical protein IFM89_000902 [Coptis chinensis]
MVFRNVSARTLTVTPSSLLNCMRKGVGVIGNREHLHPGLKAGNGWKDYTINGVISEVNKIAHKEITKVHVQNRLKTMSKFKDAYYKLMSFSGFGYNPESQTMDANPIVWEEALKVHSQLKSYMGKPMPKLLEWVEVLGNKTATSRRMAIVTSATDDANASNGVPLQQEQQDPLLGENGQLHDFPSLDESAVPATSETSPTSHSSAEKLPQTKKRNRSMGHDILMATMLNGAAIMDGALLLIAANESCPQPQTSEHLAAFDIMQLNHIIILQNKVDLVQEDVAINQHEAIQTLIKHSVADGAPIIPISGQLKYNIDVVCEYIVRKIPVPVRDLEMRLRQSPNGSSKRVLSPPTVDEMEEKTKKAKNMSHVRLKHNAQMQEYSTSASLLPRKRTKSPGVRVIGGRIYDSQNGKTCHQCRQKTMDFVAACKGERGNKACTIKFCHKCLINRYGEKAEEVDQLDDWKCPKCRGICNCSFCMKRRGHQPTGMLIHTAKATGFGSVSEMLIVNVPPEKENSSDGKDDLIPQLKSLTSAREGRKLKENKRKKLKHSNVDDDVVDGSKGDDKKLKRGSKKAYFSSGIDLNTIPHKEEEIDERVDDNTHKKRQNKLKKSAQTKGRGAKSEKNTEEPPNSSVTSLKSTENEKDNIEDMPKATTDCKHTTEPDADIPLPQGINLATVAEIQLPAEDVGPALQFLEFCSAFEEILKLKEGEPESVLRELTAGCSRRRSQYSSVAQFNIHLISLIQKDMGEEYPLSQTSSGSSWFQALGKCISESQCAFKEFSLDCFNHVMSLSFRDFRGWIHKQKERLVKRGKEAKLKVLAARDKERRLKQQMQDDVAKAIISRNGAPLSISEHESLISRIKDEAAKAHAEKLEAIELVPKKIQMSNAVRTDPILLNENGLIFWRLRGCSAEPNILLQDVGRRDSDRAEDKWFVYNPEQKKAVETYISHQRTRELTSIQSLAERASAFVIVFDQILLCFL